MALQFTQMDSGRKVKIPNVTVFFPPKVLNAAKTTLLLPQCVYKGQHTRDVGSCACVVFKMHDINVICEEYIQSQHVLPLPSNNLTTTCTYYCGYHFVEVFNWPADLPLRFIIVCVVEPMTLWREKKKNVMFTPRGAVTTRANKLNTPA